MTVCCECCVFSGRGLCDGLITRPEESYRLWRVVVCDQETSNMRRLKPATGLWKYNHNGLWRQENKQQYRQGTDRYKYVNSQSNWLLSTIMNFPNIMKIIKNPQVASMQTLRK
jgi:hypothetical protein